MEKISIYGPKLCTDPLDWVYTLNLKIDKEKIVQNQLCISDEELHKKIKKDDDFIQFEFDEIFDNELALYHLNKFLKNINLTTFKEDDDLIYIGEKIEKNFDKQKMENFCKKHNLLKPELFEIFV